MNVGYLHSLECLAHLEIYSYHVSFGKLIYIDL